MSELHIPLKIPKQEEPKKVRIEKKGKIFLYDIFMQPVKTKNYSGVLDRNKIIEHWCKLYPHKEFYIVINPDL